MKIHARWVHLRTCQECGATLCCDDSPNRHASKHAAGDRASRDRVSGTRRALAVLLSRRRVRGVPDAHGPAAPIDCQVPIRFEDVTFGYAGRPPVIGRLNLTVESGELLVLVGRSGSGKTTLLKLVNRLLLPTSGRVIVEERDTREWDGIALRRRIGYAFQDVGLFPHMSVEENVTVVPRLEGWSRARAAERAHHLLSLLGLPSSEFAARRPHELSGGQRQRVGLARALAVDPPIILMDEPFGALDPITRREVRREFNRVRALRSIRP